MKLKIKRTLFYQLNYSTVELNRIHLKKINKLTVARVKPCDQVTIDFSFAFACFKG